MTNNIYVTNKKTKKKKKKKNPKDEATHRCDHNARQYPQNTTIRYLTFKILKDIQKALFIIIPMDIHKLCLMNLAHTHVRNRLKKHFYNKVTLT